MIMIIITKTQAQITQQDNLYTQQQLNLWTFYWKKNNKTMQMRSQLLYINTCR